MRNIICFITMAILFMSCGQDKDRKKENTGKENALQSKKQESPLKTDSSVNGVIIHAQGQTTTKDISPVPPQKDTAGPANHLNKWLAETIGCDFAVNQTILVKAGFNSSGYEKKASQDFIKQAVTNEQGKKPAFRSSGKVIIIDFSDEDAEEKFFAEENRFSYSHHLSAGSNGGCIVYVLYSHIHPVLLLQFHL